MEHERPVHRGNVNDYVGLLMEHDDKGSLFAITIPKNFPKKPSSKRKLIPLPGDHGEAADTIMSDQLLSSINWLDGLSVSNNKQGRAAVSFVSLCLAYQFLRAHGSVRSDIPNLNWDEEKLLNIYAYVKAYQIKKTRDQYIPLPGYRYRGVGEMAIDAASMGIDTTTGAAKGAVKGAVKGAAKGFAGGLLGGEPVTTGASAVNGAATGAAKGAVSGAVKGVAEGRFDRRMTIDNEEGSIYSPFVNWHHKHYFNQVFSEIYSLLERYIILDLAKVPSAKPAVQNLQARSFKTWQILRDLGFIIDGNTATTAQKARSATQHAAQKIKPVVEKAKAIKNNVKQGVKDAIKGKLPGR